MAAALTAWSASAQLYVTGGSVEGAPAAWNPASPLEVAEADGVYTFQATGEFKISTAKGTWNDFNSGAYQLDGAWNVSGETATANLKQGDQNIAPAKAGAIVTYTVKSDLSSISASLTGGEVEKFYQVHGEIFGDPSWSSVVLTKNGDNWEWTGEVVVAGSFGVKVCNEAGSQIDWIGGAATITEANTEYAFNAGDNSSCTLTGTYTIVYNPTANTIKFNGEGGEPQPQVVDLFLVGDFNTWTPADAAYKMANEGNLYTISLESLAAGEFKIMGDTWAISYGAEGDPSWEEAQPVDVAVNTPMNAWAGSGCNFKTTEDLVNVTITFVKSANASEASTLTVAGQSGVEMVEAVAADAPAVYYNLQGMRVAAPEAGQLYIVNRAGKISKEIAR